MESMYGRTGGVKSSRGGKALLSGIMTCGRCRRRLSGCLHRQSAEPTGISRRQAKPYDGPAALHDFRRPAGRCRDRPGVVGGGGTNGDRCCVRGRSGCTGNSRKISSVSGTWKCSRPITRQAWPSVATRPAIRTIASLPRSWRRVVRDLETRQPAERRSDITVDPNAFTNLADNLSAAWNAPGVTMRARRQLLRTLITDIIVDVDDDARDVILTLHWRGGQHSELRVRKPRAEERGCATTEDALAK